jgi:putative hydrolases of HD superfamily
MEYSEMPHVLQNRIDFLLEIDLLKEIERQTVLIAGNRHENSAEHSWHVAMCAAVLVSHAGGDIDLNRVLMMLLVHDIVEIDAGDTFAYDEVGRQVQHAREKAASRRLFGLLPKPQSEEMAALWTEFDAQETPEARYANAVDRFMPLLHNFYTEGQSWQKHGVCREQVLERMACIQTGAPSLWPYVENLIDDAVRRGYLLP